MLGLGIGLFGGTPGGNPALKLLLGFDGTAGATSFVDESPSARPLFRQGTGAIDATAKFGSGSIVCPDENSGLYADPSADWDFGTGAYSVECFVRHATTSSGMTRGYVGQWGATAAEQSWFLWIYAGSLMIRQASPGGAVFDIAAAFFPTAAPDWHHFVACRNAAGRTRVFANGVLKAASNTVTDLGGKTGRLGVGHVPGFPTLGTPGRFDEVRVFKGYVPPEYDTDAGYTVPTAAFPRA